MSSNLEEPKKCTCAFSKISPHRANKCTFRGRKGGATSVKALNGRNLPPEDGLVSELSAEPAPDAEVLHDLSNNDESFGEDSFVFVENGVSNENDIRDADMEDNVEHGNPETGSSVVDETAIGVNRMDVADDSSPSVNGRRAKEVKKKPNLADRMLRQVKCTLEGTSESVTGLAKGAGTFIANGGNKVGKLKDAVNNVLPNDKKKRRVDPGADDPVIVEECRAFDEYVVVAVFVAAIGYFAFISFSVVRIISSGTILVFLIGLATSTMEKLKLLIFVLSVTTIMMTVSHRLLGYAIGIFIRKKLGGTAVSPNAYNIDFDWVSIRWGLDRNELVVSKLTWNNPTRFACFKHFIKIKHFRVSLESKALYQYLVHHTDLVIEEINIDGCEIYLQRDSKEGDFNFVAAMNAHKNESNEIGDQSTRAENENASSVKSLKIQLNRFLVDNLKLHVSDKSIQLGSDVNVFSVDVVILTRRDLTKKPSNDGDGYRRGRTVYDLTGVIVHELITAALRGNSVGLLALLSSGLFKHLLKVMKLDKIKLPGVSLE